ncbi:hypothetical protein [Paraburkholderia sp. BL17N1]|uniref:hypothetical protein n=1 Tax=Paraburkholderia sp. BL17N1 TaxID=1938798 RepID=UPI001A7E9AB6|nr:hypothetical protein [Paraburkholderia sp. BL17N1]
MIDVYLDEADPANWPGVGTAGEHMTKEERGDRYWCKKNAAATVMLATETRKLIANDKAALGRDPYGEPEMDRRIQDAEKRAADLVKKVQDGTSRAGFLKRATGGA